MKRLLLIPLSLLVACSQDDFQGDHPGATPSTPQQVSYECSTASQSHFLSILSSSPKATPKDACELASTIETTNYLQQKVQTMAETQGNPYRDKKSGKFTSGPGQSSGSSSKGSSSSSKSSSGKTGGVPNYLIEPLVVKESRDTRTKKLVSTYRSDSRIKPLMKTTRQHEGYRKKVYLDTLGKPTVGVGHLLPDSYKSQVGKEPFTEKQLEEFLQVDMQAAIKGAAANFENISVLPNQVQDALVEMAFQLGQSRQAKFKKMIEAVHKGNFEEAARQALDSRWARQTPVRAKHVANALLKARDDLKNLK